jgi:hypothetical protein
MTDRSRPLLARRTFYRLYTFEAAVLIVLRFTSYRFKRQHYYLLDWCYFGNALLILSVWKFPTSVLLVKVGLRGLLMAGWHFGGSPDP